MRLRRERLPCGYRICRVCRIRRVRKRRRRYRGICRAVLVNNIHRAFIRVLWRRPTQLRALLRMLSVILCHNAARRLHEPHRKRLFPGADALQVPRQKLARLRLLRFQIDRIACRGQEQIGIRRKRRPRRFIRRNEERAALARRLNQQPHSVDRPALRALRDRRLQGFAYKRQRFRIHRLPQQQLARCVPARMHRARFIHTQRRQCNLTALFGAQRFICKVRFIDKLALRVQPLCQ